MLSIRNYLLLVRLPNAFTAPPDIMAGYFAVASPLELNLGQLLLLMTSSAMLYTYGIVMNDFFDFNIDKKERPDRPLPSGKVSKKNTLIIGMSCLVGGNLLVSAANPSSLIISGILSAVIFLYDYKLKHGFGGPFAMGLARFLNVFLGASAVLSYPFAWQILFVPAVIFMHVFAITILSKKEAGVPTNSKSSIVIAAIIIGAINVMILILLHGTAFFFNLALYAGLAIFTFIRLFDTSQKRIQDSIKYLVLGIIILDSVFVSAYAGVYYGLITLSFIIPSILLSKRLYMT